MFLRIKEWMKNFAVLERNCEQFKTQVVLFTEDVLNLLKVEKTWFLKWNEKETLYYYKQINQSKEDLLLLFLISINTFIYKIYQENSLKYAIILYFQHLLNKYGSSITVWCDRYIYIVQMISTAIILSFASETLLFYCLLLSLSLGFITFVIAINSVSSLCYNLFRFISIYNIYFCNKCKQIPVELIFFWKQIIKFHFSDRILH